MKRKFFRELAALGLPSGLPPREPVVEADLASLPEPAQRYLRFMGVLGRPRDGSFLAHLRGRFRTRPDQGWMPMEAWQYSSGVELARVFYLKVGFFGFVPVLGRDTYVRGRGRMLVRILDLLTVADGQGEAFDVGELVTWLNDAVLIAPSLLLRPEVVFGAVDDGAFDLSLTDRGHTVKARVFVDARGAAYDFETTDRYYGDPKQPHAEPVRTRWTTPIDGWQELGGRRLPTTGRAVWHPPEGDFAYAELTFGADALVFDVPPRG